MIDSLSFYPLLATSLVSISVFVVGAAIVLAGACGVVLAKNAVHSALFLVMTLFGIAVLFVSERANFLAAVQIIVYAGAIVVLFLFVIMLLGIDNLELQRIESKPRKVFGAVLIGLVVLAEVLLLSRNSWTSGAPSVSGVAFGPGPTISRLADSIFSSYLLAFEATSALLIIAVISAVILVRRNNFNSTDEDNLETQIQKQILELDPLASSTETNASKETKGTLL